MPECVVVRLVEEEPEQVDVTRQPAQNEDDGQSQHDAGHFLSRGQQPLLVPIPCECNLLPASHQHASNLEVKDSDHNNGDGEEDDESDQVVDLGHQLVRGVVLVRQGAAHPDFAWWVVCARHLAAQHGVRQGQEEAQNPHGHCRQRLGPSLKHERKFQLDPSVIDINKVNVYSAFRHHWYPHGAIDSYIICANCIMYR